MPNAKEIAELAKENGLSQKLFRPDQPRPQDGRDNASAYKEFVRTHAEELEDSGKSPRELWFTHLARLPYDPRNDNDPAFWKALGFNKNPGPGTASARQAYYGQRSLNARWDIEDARYGADNPDNHFGYSEAEYKRFVACGFGGRDEFYRHLQIQTVLPEETEEGNENAN